ncbi:uncharacterized protein BROUX77_000095 [Berkeleyomyces rouxiae]|uniref:uncharacterized protein n=2 Tax=Berkeleyomyces rouxiae TaxID=2035830 RepID=UPI003B78C8CB
MAPNYFAPSDDDSSFHHSFREDSILPEVPGEPEVFHEATMAHNNEMQGLPNSAPATPVVVRNTSSDLRPVRYDHTRPDLYPTYRSYVEMKYRYDHSHFNGAGGFILHCYGLLADNALLQAQTYIARMSRDPSLENVDKFLEFLDSCFEDTSASRRALLELHTLKCRGASAPEHLARVSRLMQIAGCYRLSHEERIMNLRRTLPGQVMSALAGFPDPPTYEQYAQQVLNAWQKLDECRHAHPPRNPARTSQFRNVPAQHSPDAMDWAPTHNSAPRRAKWVSKEELQSRRARGLCLRCGAGGHMSPNCPFERARPPVQQSVRAATNLPPPVLEEEGEEYYETAEEDSGN